MSVADFGSDCENDDDSADEPHHAQYANNVVAGLEGGIGTFLNIVFL